MAHQSVTLGPIVELLNLVTGFDMTGEDFLRTGERIFNLKRIYNIRCGVRRKDDTLPERFMRLTITGEESRHRIAPLSELLDEYYAIRGWDMNGVPKDAVLEKLGLPAAVMG